MIKLIGLTKVLYKAPKFSRTFINLTDRSAKKFTEIIQNKEDKELIIQLSAEREGCMGLYYKLGFVKESNIQKGDEIIETKGLKILLDGSSFLYLMGTTIDYTDDDFNAKFVFLNPNASREITLKMQADVSISLIKELKASKFLPKYNEPAVKSIIEEIIAFFELINSKILSGNIRASDEEWKASLLFDLHQMGRHKRCLLAYFHTRLEKLQRICWETAHTLPEHIQENCSPLELQYFKEYSHILTTYNKEMPYEILDLCVDLEPPKDLLVEVRILEDCGEVELADQGKVIFEKNSTHYARRSDIDHLIRKGVAKQIF